LFCVLRRFEGFEGEEGNMFTADSKQNWKSKVYEWLTKINIRSSTLQNTSKKSSVLESDSRKDHSVDYGADVDLAHALTLRPCSGGVSLT
jgi:hypothetical protein